MSTPAAAQGASSNSQSDAPRSCPACAGAKAVAYGVSNGLAMLKCGTCGTVFTALLPSDDGEDYDAYYHPGNLHPPEFLNARMDEIVRSFARYRQNNRLLDVGFGSGMLMQAATRAGWEAEGIEVSSPAVEHGEKLGLKVFHGELEKAQFDAASFDVVTAVEVLEHLPDPESVMVEVARILRPGGLFWATTPHGAGVSARVLKTAWSVVSPPEHLQLFSCKGVSSLLLRAGFQEVKTFSGGTNPFEILHALRRKPKAEGEEAAFDRVTSSHRLNDTLSHSGPRRALKASLNAALNATHMGDSLKIYAVR